MVKLKEAYFHQLPVIDILINAAGMGIIKNMDVLSFEKTLQVIQITFCAPFSYRTFLPAMKDEKGLIINIRRTR